VTVPLPPLPELRPDVFWTPAGQNVIDVLSGEHRRLGALSAWLAETQAPDRRRQIADVVTATVVRHLSAEEQYLYPTLRVALPDGEQVAAREIAEDRALMRTLQELATADAAADFDRQVTALGLQLDRHCRAARELFPRLRESVSDVDLVRLGNRVQIAGEAAPTRPHPATPATPPWNKVVDPAIGIVDKARDLLAGRTTYADDL
jgi:hypothetical protein